MQKKFLISVISVLLALQLQAQHSIHFSFPAEAGQRASLLVYNGFEGKQLATATADSLGNFHFDSPARYQGVALIQFGNGNGLNVMIDNESQIDLKLI
jgi:hypothetical protein